ncbi:MAG TPA: DALR domain-containing protein, partial [Candidatus Binataceae bacterium]|nr:DALR domain-containing protein [Candidatus Binataceae bacterium]
RNLSDAEWAAEYRGRFQDALNNDLNTSQSLAVVLELVAEAYRRNDNRIWNTLKGLDQVIGLGLEQRVIEAAAEEIPAEVVRLGAERERARKSKDFKRADELRHELDARGFEIRDSKEGPLITRKRKAS